MSNRREFLSSAAAAGAVLSLNGAAPQFLQSAAAESNNKNDRVLVVVQLSGGNDGLNTVVPFKDPAYKKNRPKLAIPTTQLLKIDKSFGFHPAMRGFANLLEKNKLAIIQGVGYDNPNRSHFESMDIWHSCKRKSETRSAGWLGRYLDQSVRNTRGGDVPALHLGSEKQPLALVADKTRVPSVKSLSSFRLKEGKVALRKAIRDLADAKRESSNGLLKFVQSSTSAALDASRRVEKASKNYKPKFKYPESELARKMRTIAQLIDAGLSTRVYYVQLDGFDTHAQQPAAHQALLAQLGGAVEAFMNDITQHGHGNRVAVMCFSEFGRRVKENASDGTDHGAAAPMFIAGRVKPGLIGKQPSLTDLHDGDLKHHTDFRSVYAEVLENWLNWKSEPVLGKKYKPVRVFV